MGTKAKVGSTELLLFTSMILCKFPEFSEESVRLIRGRRRRSPHLWLARGEGF